MRIHVIKIQTIKTFVLENGSSKSCFNEWINKVKAANWEKPNDIKRTFNTADLLGKNSHRIIFDMCGNNFRMICKCAYGKEEVHLFICWIGTHAAYTKLCKQEKQYTINNY